jgi:hypothetical protein
MALHAKSVWGIKYNDELHSLYKAPDMERVIKAARINWLAHLVRREPRHEKI